MARRKFSGKSVSLLPRVGGISTVKKEVFSSLKPSTKQRARKPKRMRPLLGLL